MTRHRTKRPGGNTEQGAVLTCSSTRWLFAIVIGVLLFMQGGCGQGARRVFRGKRTPRATEISKEELREALDNFDEFAAAKNAQGANELDQLVPGLKTRKANLIRRTRLRQAVRTMLDHEDPVIAFIEIWGLCVRVRYYLQEGEGLGLYGEYQSLAIDTWQEIEERIEQIGQEFLDEDTFAETRDNVHRFARARPITGTFSNIVVYATEVQPGQPSPFESVIAVPMAPFSAMKGVDRTASAIYSMRGSMERISDIVEELPESAQWQLLLLLMEMEETEVVKTVLTGMSKFSDSSVRFADIADKLPERLREQASILIDEVDAKQANLQVTLERAEKTAVAMEQTFSKANVATETLGRTANSITEAVGAWESAANATGQVIKELSKRPPRKDKSPTIKISDYRDTIQEVTNAANELRALAAEVRELLEPLPGHIAEVNNRVIGVVGQAGVQAHSLTDHIAWRMVQLIASVFVLALLYRLTAAYLVLKRQR
jgi:hypothetical protein